jgi:hypothetical protein
MSDLTFSARFYLFGCYLLALLRWRACCTPPAAP